MNLKDKTYHGVFWSAVDAFGARLVQFVIGVILARLLLPEQFGLIGMLAVFIAVAQSLLDSGFGSALIQKKDVTDLDSSSVFYFNILIGICMAGLLSLVAPWIAAFYEQPVLTPLMRAMSLVIVINSFGSVQAVLLTRSINFKTLTKVRVASGIGSGLVGVLMAYYGFGVWSLVAQQICAATLTLILLWVLNPWRPRLAFSLVSLRQMFTFGSRLLASSLISQVFNNIYYVVIGKMFSPAVLGFYTRAKRLEELPSHTLTRVITRVSFPVFSSIHEDVVRLKSGLRKALGAVIFISSPVMIGMAVVAEPLVRVLLTEKWLPCVPYLRLLAVLGLFMPLHSLNLNAILAKGRSDLFLRLEVLKRALTVVNIIVMSRWGVTAMIYGQIGLSVAAYYLNSYYVSRLIKYTAFDQIRDIAAYFACAGVMGAVVHALGYVAFPTVLFQLIAQVITGFIVYPLLCGLFRLPAFFESLDVVSRKLPFVKCRAA